MIGPPFPTESMPVDPVALGLLQQIMPPGTPRVSELPVNVCRRLMDEFLPFAGPKAELESIRDYSLAGITLRMYRSQGEKIQPACVYFHGGGWTLGRLEHYDALCSQIAKESQWTVISVDYRLAPENKFPIPVFDCWTALQVIGANAAALSIDSTRIVVAGDSAGGNLAAAVSLLARDYRFPLTGQILIYPAMESIANHESYKFDYFLGRSDMTTFWNYYLHSPSDGDCPLASPLRARSLTGLPSAAVLTAEFDPLRDEGEEYGERLRQAGVETRIWRYAGMIHGFVNFGAVIPQARQAIVQISTHLRCLAKL